LVESKEKSIFASKSIENVVNMHLKIVELWRNLQAKKKK
jgi:hypothetical protein